MISRGIVTIEQYKGLFSSKHGSWDTPQDLFDNLNKEFNFTLDVCATSNNAKCDTYYSEDSLNKEWNGICWMNPPYGRKIGEWIKKAATCKCTVVALLPARTDTKWFHDYILNKHEIRFIKGRVYFGNGQSRSPFPSMIVVFRRDAKE